MVQRYSASVPARRIDDAEGRYVVFLKNTFPNEFSLDGLRIVLDCANGAAYKVAPLALWELGAEVISIGVDSLPQSSVDFAKEYDANFPIVPDPEQLAACAPPIVMSTSSLKRYFSVLSSGRIRPTDTSSVPLTSIGSGYM